MGKESRQSCISCKYYKNYDSYYCRNQLPDELKVEKSDFVIVNDDIEMVIPQIIKIHKKLL